MLRRLKNSQTKERKKRTFGTVTDENQDWMLSGKSGHREQRLLASHLKHDLCCFLQIESGPANQYWMGFHENEDNDNYDISK